MGLVVNTNLLSLNAQRSLNRTQSKLGTSGGHYPSGRYNSSLNSGLTDCFRRNIFRLTLIAS